MGRIVCRQATSHTSHDSVRHGVVRYTDLMFEARASADYRMAAHTVGSALSRIALAATDSAAVDCDG